MAPKNTTTDRSQGDLPFGTIAGEDTAGTGKKKASRKAATSKKAATKKATTKKAASKKAATKKTSSKKAATKKAPSKKKAAAEAPVDATPAPKKTAAARPKPETKRESEPKPEPKSEPSPSRERTPEPAPEPRSRSRSAPEHAHERDANPAPPQGGGSPPGEGKRRRRRRRRGKGGGQNAQGQPPQHQNQNQNQHQHQGAQHQQHPQGQGKKRKKRQGGQEGGGQQAQPLPESGEGMFVLDKGGYGVLRQAEFQYRPSKSDIYVSKRLIQTYRLRDGMLLEAKLTRGQKHKYQVLDVLTIDGKEPHAWKNSRSFKSLTSIDPDFHYATGDVLNDVSMRIVDLLCPIGRGQRGLIVAPPRSGKTTLMRQFAAGIEKGYPDVHLMVLLIDERPEEATEWTRSVKNGEVFVSTADETSKSHIQLAEAVWMRACRLTEMGEDVVLLLDSITRLARAYNNQSGAGGRTMSGGLDSRAMEKPRKIFGSARNTVEAGSLTILGTTLVETGSRMDQLVFEEFKGTGNMELVLSRKLADRRIFPAIDVERSGTRKEEKLLGMRRLKQIHTLRRVLSRLHFAEAIETLITRLDDVEKTDDFLNRFTLDPEA